MILRCLGGLFLQNDSGTIVASLRYVTTGYPRPVLEVSSFVAGVGLVVTNCDAGMGDNHNAIAVPGGVDYFPFV